MEQAFKVFDKNDDGRISKDEMKEVLSDIGIEISETELNDFMKRVDTDGKLQLISELLKLHCHCFKSSTQNSRLITSGDVFGLKI